MDNEERQRLVDELRGWNAEQLWEEFDRLVPRGDYSFLNVAGHEDPAGWYVDARTALYQHRGTYLHALAITNELARRQGELPNYDVMGQ